MLQKKSTQIERNLRGICSTTCSFNTAKLKKHIVLISEIYLITLPNWSIKYLSLLTNYFCLMNCLSSFTIPFNNTPICCITCLAVPVKLETMMQKA